MEFLIKLDSMLVKELLHSITKGEEMVRPRSVKIQSYLIDILNFGVYRMGYFSKLLGRSHLIIDRISELLFSLIFYQIEGCSVK